MSLGAGCSVLTRSQVILLLASLRTTAVVESAQWDPGKEQLKTFQPLFCFCVSTASIFFLKSLRGEGKGGHLGDHGDYSGSLRPLAHDFPY